MKLEKNGKGILSLYLKWPAWVAVYFLLVSFIVLVLNFEIGCIVFVASLIYLIFAIYLQLVKYNNLNSAIHKLVMAESNIQGTLIKNMSIPYAILSMEGRVLWANDAFLNISKKITIGMKACEYFLELTQKLFETIDVGKAVCMATGEDKKYKAYIRVFDKNSDENISSLKIYDDESKVVLVYLHDETEIYNLITENDNNKQVTGFIYIDNFDEATENIEDSKASMLAAMVDRRLTRYISFNKGILKKMDRDKYFFVTTKKDIEDMQNDKFSILDQVKEILNENNVPLTLSIGVAYENKSIEQNHDQARMAIDMAMGRGGDQAVVKVGQNITYYGAKGVSSSKNERIRARVKSKTFRELLDTKDKVVIMGHANGDYDSFGACIGIYTLVRTLGKEVKIVVNSLTYDVEMMKTKFENMDNYEKGLFLSGDETLTYVDDNTLLVVVDHNTSKISDEPRLFDAEIDYVVFDHHRIQEGSLSNAILSYVDPSASSTCELISEIMNYFDETIKLKQIEADTMLCGIYVDTMSFTCQTSAKTFEAAGFLRRKGADIDRVRKYLRVDLDMEKAKIEAVNNAELYKNEFAITTVQNVENVDMGVLKAKVANELIDVNGVKASIVIAEDNNNYSISSRSIDEINVQVMMEMLGGGGHRSQAGAKIEANSIEEAIEKVKGAIDKMIDGGNK